jgi:hypothetical protein
MENPGSRNNNIASALFRTWLILGSIYIISLVFGFGIFLIVFGILFAMRRIAIYWKPSRKFLINQLGLAIIEPSIQNRSARYRLFMTIYWVGISLVYVIIGSIAIKLGIDILIRDGFLNQNLVYLIFFR